MAEFSIHPLILASSEPLARLTLCDARLQADARWPWIVLSPRRPGALEIDHLASRDRAQLMDEIVAAGAAVRAMGAAIGRPVEKLNIGAIGNLVSQLHIHVIGRRGESTIQGQRASACSRASQRVRRARGSLLARMSGWIENSAMGWLDAVRPAQSSAVRAGGL